MDKITNKKIIILIAPPRSLSTAFLRMMAAHKDFKIINEPSCSVFNRIHYPRSKIFYSNQSPNSYSKVKKNILAIAKQHHIFIKEMSFSFEELIISEPGLIKNPNIMFVFLLRNPHCCIISYYKKVPSQFLDFIMLDLQKLTGYSALYNIFNILTKEAIHQPYIIHAEQLYTNTASTVKNFFDYINIPYQQECLNWQNLGKKFTGFLEWQENKKWEFTHHWHREAIVSHGFHQPTNYEVDEKGNPTFSEIQHNTHRQKCIEIYHENNSLYKTINLAFIKQQSLR